MPLPTGQTGELYRGMRLESSVLLLKSLQLPQEFGVALVYFLGSTGERRGGTVPGDTTWPFL